MFQIPVKNNMFKIHIDDITTYSEGEYLFKIPIEALSLYYLRWTGICQQE